MHALPHYYRQKRGQMDNNHLPDVSQCLELLRTMLTEDHIHNNVFGSVMDKETFLRDIETGILKFQKYERHTSNYI